MDIFMAIKVAKQFTDPNHPQHQFYRDHPGLGMYRAMNGQFMYGYITDKPKIRPFWTFEEFLKNHNYRPLCRR